MHVSIYDTTLRDGSQGEGIAFSRIDKIRVAEALDSFGVAYIEGGWPGSNPKDMAFFEAARSLALQHARIAAFGSTRRANVAVEDDGNIRALLESEAPVTTIFGKSWLLHVHDVLRVAPETNIEMIRDSCACLLDHGREVIFDAEHFFDGYKDDPDYALAALRAAVAGGATVVVLCDTNGGCLPSQVAAITRTVRAAIPAAVTVGIHTHNDGGMAVANAIAAVEAGATHVQGTVNGIGERCGNADLCSIMPNLELKMGIPCLPEGRLQRLSEISEFVSDHANQRPNPALPFVGKSAFAHKGGIHVDAVRKQSASYEHIDPAAVGNNRRVLISDLSGASNIMLKAAEHNLDLTDKAEARRILGELKKLEDEGYEFESADASFHLMTRKVLEQHSPFFNLEGFRVIIEKRGHDEPCLSEATIKVTVGDETELTAAEGDGPVNALDNALRKALLRFYPEIAEVVLKDFRVRILDADADAGTQARTRVLIESSDGARHWGTVGVSENIIEASWQALVDSVEYVLYQRRDRDARADDPAAADTGECSD